MQVAYFYLVSIFLSCVKLSLGTLVSPTAQSNGVLLGGGVISQTSNSSTPYPSSSNYNFASSGSIHYPSLKHDTSKTTAISAVKKNKSDTFTSKNGNDELSGSFYDNPGESGTLSFKLYNAIACIFKLIFKTWKEYQSELEDIIAETFGIPKNIVESVNKAMAILLEMQRSKNKLLQLCHLVRMFYYMFDIGHMIQRDKNRKTVINQIQSLIVNIEQDRALNDIDEYGDSDLDTVVKNLNDLLTTFKNGDYNNNDIMVNAPLMKGLMLINKTENDEFNYELNKLKRSLSKYFLEEVENKQYEIDGSLIAENHVEVIRNTMPCLFILLDNHIELLKILSTDTLLHDTEKEKIHIANQLHRAVISTFINRLKNFGTLNRKEISDLCTITQLLEKLDTGKTVLENTEEPSTPELDIKKLLSSTETAIAAVLNLAGEEDVEKWKNNSVFKFKNFQKNQNKQYYINLLTHNADTAFALVGAFEKRFLDKIDYKKFHEGGNQLIFVEKF